MESQQIPSKTDGEGGCAHLTEETRGGAVRGVTGGLNGPHYSNNPAPTESVKHGSNEPKRAKPTIVVKANTSPDNNKNNNNNKPEESKPNGKNKENKKRKSVLGLGSLYHYLSDADLKVKTAGGPLSPLIVSEMKQYGLHSRKAKFTISFLRRGGGKAQMYVPTLKKFDPKAGAFCWKGNQYFKFANYTFSVPRTEIEKDAKILGDGSALVDLTSTKGGAPIVLEDWTLEDTPDGPALRPKTYRSSKKNLNTSFAESQYLRDLLVHVEWMRWCSNIVSEFPSLLLPDGYDLIKSSSNNLLALERSTRETYWKSDRVRNQKTGEDMLRPADTIAEFLGGLVQRKPVLSVAVNAVSTIWAWGKEKIEDYKDEAALRSEMIITDADFIPCGEKGTDKVEQIPVLSLPGDTVVGDGPYSDSLFLMAKRALKKWRSSRQTAETLLNKVHQNHQNLLEKPVRKQIGMSRKELALYMACNAVEDVAGWFFWPSIPIVAAVELGLLYYINDGFTWEHLFKVAATSLRMLVLPRSKVLSLLIHATINFAGLVAYYARNTHHQQPIEINSQSSNLPKVERLDATPTFVESNVFGLIDLDDLGMNNMPLASTNNTDEAMTFALEARLRFPQSELKANSRKQRHIAQTYGCKVLSVFFRNLPEVTREQLAHYTTGNSVKRTTTPDATTHMEDLRERSEKVLTELQEAIKGDEQLVKQATVFSRRGVLLGRNVPKSRPVIFTNATNTHVVRASNVRFMTLVKKNMTSKGYVQRITLPLRRGQREPTRIYWCYGFIKDFAHLVINPSRRSYDYWVVMVGGDDSLIFFIPSDRGKPIVAYEFDFSKFDSSQTKHVVAWFRSLGFMDERAQRIHKEMYAQRSGKNVSTGTSFDLPGLGITGSGWTAPRNSLICASVMITAISEGEGHPSSVDFPATAAKYGFNLTNELGPGARALSSVYRSYLPLERIDYSSNLSGLTFLGKLVFPMLYVSEGPRGIGAILNPSILFRFCFAIRGNYQPRKPRLDRFVSVEEARELGLCVDEKFKGPKPLWFTNKAKYGNMYPYLVRFLAMTVEYKTDNPRVVAQLFTQDSLERGYLETAANVTHFLKGREWMLRNETIEQFVKAEMDDPGLTRAVEWKFRSNFEGLTASLYYQAREDKLGWPFPSRFENLGDMAASLGWKDLERPALCE